MEFDQEQLRLALEKDEQAFRWRYEGADFKTVLSIAKILAPALGEDMWRQIAVEDDCQQMSLATAELPRIVYQRRAHLLITILSKKLRPKDHKRATNITSEMRESIGSLIQNVPENMIIAAALAFGILEP